MPICRRVNSGFSLVELSVTLLLISTILFLLIRSSEIIVDSKIKLLGKEVSNIQNITETFRSKYSYLPGDLPNADEYFGCTTGAAPTGCNGNANGLIDAQNESYRYWEHLNLASLLPGTYSGVVNGSEPLSSQSNLFASALTESGLYYPHDDFSADEYPNINKNKITLGRFIESNTEAQIGALSPRDAMSYDLKYDDGKPRLGKVMARTFLNTSATRVGISSTLCLSDIESSTISNISASTYTTSSDLELCELILFLE